MSDAEDRWKPRPWLEHHPWSLLRSVGMKQRTARALMGLWVAGAFVALIAHRPLDWVHLIVGAIGLLMLRYVLQRLQGLPAEFSGPSEAMTEDWPFQIRLAIDVFAVTFLLWSCAVLVLGLPTIRALVA